MSIKLKAIEHVLKAFKDMGATPDDLLREAVKLGSDERYLSSWAEVTKFEMEAV